MSNHLVVTSGGLDSTTLLYRVVQEFGNRGPYGLDNVSAIGFDYGQRHKKELGQAQTISEHLGIRFNVVDITSITEFLAPGGSSLVSDAEVPEGHYAEENMKATVVPNRNMIMASIAAGHGIAIGADRLWMGVHAGDHFIYPDCRPRFFHALNAAIVSGNEGFGPVENWEEGTDLLTSRYYVQTPFINNSKDDIAFEALQRNVPIDLTWSCYKGREIHCGKCGTCVERLEAINNAIARYRKETGREYSDLTQYEDASFWQETLDQYSNR